MCLNIYLNTFNFAREFIKKYFLKLYEKYMNFSAKFIINLIFNKIIRIRAQFYINSYTILENIFICNIKTQTQTQNKCKHKLLDMYYNHSSKLQIL